MCGRFTLHAPEDEILAAFDIESLPVGFSQAEFEPRYNIAPSQDVAIIRMGAAGRELSMARWGLVPAWSREPRSEYSTINARMETAAEKPAYRVPFRRRRCLLPANGFFEWQKTPGGKQPWYITLRQDAPFAFAGLWDRWEKDDDVLDTCTVLTRPAGRFMSDIHVREPVILPRQTYSAWLDPESRQSGQILAFLGRLPEAPLQALQVSTYVNNPANDDIGCIRETS